MCDSNKQNWILTQKDKQDIYSYMPYLEHITWWGGEPTISVLFYEMLEYSLQYKNIKHTVITNGQYMPDKFLDIVSKNNIEVILSIDSVDRHKYEAIRKGASFDKLKTNLSKLSNACDVEFIKINIVVMKDNIYEISDIISFIRSFGINKFSVRPVSCSTFQNKNLMLFSSDIDIISKQICKFSNIDLYNCVSIIKKDNKKCSLEGICQTPWTDVTFTYRYSLICDNLCSFFKNKEYYLNGVNMIEFWNSKVMQQLRKKIIKNKICNLSCKRANINIK